jgi:hypothetical protein
MGTKNIDKVIYQLTIEDLQNVANDVLDRELSEKEIKLLENKIGDYIHWYDLIHSAIIQNIKK